MAAQPEAPRPEALRVLLAHDLSAAADLAAGLVLHARWPESTVVRVISSPIGIDSGLSSFANLREARAHTRQVNQAIASTHDRVAADLHEAGLVVETATVPGRPGQAIVSEADRFGADLIVVGVRRQGSIAASLLGSVSRSVVERASCSVLVARSTTTRRLLLASDGSEQASFATGIVGTWPMFDDARVRLLAVGAATSLAREAVDQLAQRGRHVQSEARQGDVATEIVAAARQWPADVVVVGSNAEPFLQRLILGTVARRVLDGVASSVLVARPRPTTEGGSTGPGIR